MCLPDLFCSANDLPALGVSDFESPFAYGTGDGFFTPNEKYLIHGCRMFHNVILLSLILGTTLRNINLAGESSYCGGFFISPQYQLVGFILTSSRKTRQVIVTGFPATFRTEVT